MFSNKYMALLVLLTASPAALAASEKSIGYDSVGEAYEALRKDPGTEVTVQKGWPLASQIVNGNRVLWTFTPKDHAAFPAAIRREIAEKDGALVIEMTTLCEAAKADCDRLIEDFESLNKKVKRAMESGG